MTDAVGEHEHEHEPMWTDDSWREWNDYADQVTVQVRFKEWPGAEDADESWLMEANGAAWSKEWLNRQLVELSGIDSSGGCCGRGTFYLDSRERTTEWGASASVVEVILTLAESQLSNATWAALGALSTHLATRLKKRREGDGWLTYELEWNDERARDAALSAVRRLRDIPHEALSVRSVEMRDDGEMVVEVHDSTSGSLFSVQVKGAKGGDVYTARVRKVTEPGTQ